MFVFVWVYAYVNTGAHMWRPHLAISVHSRHLDMLITSYKIKWFIYYLLFSPPPFPVSSLHSLSWLGTRGNLPALTFQTGITSVFHYTWFIII